MIEPFVHEDIDPFLAAAKAEGWLCERWEFEFLLRSFGRGCFACREQGSTKGYITAIKYGKSGWIGNLLVHPEARRRGIGRSLMKQAIAVLLMDGVETVWLTASEQGAALYRRLGFVEIDHIHRWTGMGTAGGSNKAAPWEQELLREVDGAGKAAPLDHELLRDVDSAGIAAPFDFELIREVDRAGWGERRDRLLRVICDRGPLYTTAHGFVCCQRWDDGTQLGPWGCLVPGQAPGLLDQALGGAGKRVFLDVPAGNHLAGALLKERGFQVKGSNILMYLGAEPEYQSEKVFALASMGSMG